jgi:hypothetical protein
MRPDQEKEVLELLISREQKLMKANPAMREKSLYTIKCLESILDKICPKKENNENQINLFN